MFGSMYRGIVKLWNSLGGLAPDRISPDYRLYHSAIKNPVLRRHLVDCSIVEDEENSYYNGILNTVAMHCVGTMPILLSDTQNEKVDDSLELRWLAWGAHNEIGSALRQVRRDAALTGIGIGIPYTKVTALDPVKLSIRSVPATSLTTPPGAGLEDRIINGIQYDKNWDPEKIFILKDKGTLDYSEYKVKDILFFYKRGKYMGTPECGPAFTMYPSINRFLKAVVRGEEYRESVPMAMEQDPAIYIPSDREPLRGKFEYEAGMIPTLPPGTKLVGLPAGATASDRVGMLKMMVAAAARCVNMPGNLALGDSSGHNMATAQVDIQPWKIFIETDRFDFQPQIVNLFWMWHKEAQLIESYLDYSARNVRQNTFIPFWNYDVLFHHPDPGKMANARATDLKSGATTLTRVYAEQGKKAIRELRKDAKLYGISVEELLSILLQSRTGIAEAQPQDEEDDSKQPNNQ